MNSQIYEANIDGVVMKYKNFDAYQDDVMARSIAKNIWDRGGTMKNGELCKFLLWSDREIGSLTSRQLNFYNKEIERLFNLDQVKAKRKREEREIVSRNIKLTLTYISVFIISFSCGYFIN